MVQYTYRGRPEKAQRLRRNNATAGGKENFSTDDGSSVKGDQLFVAFAEDGVTGRMADKLFIRDGIALPTLTPGMMLDISFNRKGKVESVKTAPVSGNKA